MKILIKYSLVISACLFSNEIGALSVSIEAPILENVAVEQNYVAASIAKNLCGRMVYMRGIEVLGCGVDAKIQETKLRITTTVKGVNGELSFNSVLWNAESKQIAPILTVSGGAEYLALTLELHTEKIIRRLEEIEQAQVKQSKPTAIEAVSKPEAKHHDGFFLSFYTGSGWTELGALHSGVPVSAGVKIGRTLWDTLFVFGAVEVALIDSPIIKKHTRLARDGKYTTFAGNLDGIATIEDFSVGWGFYTSSNYVFQAALGLGAFQINPADSPAAQNYGNFESSLYPSLSLSFGREWWVSDNWGVGLALIGRSVFAAPEWALSFGLAVTATYN